MFENKMAFVASPDDGKIDYQREVEALMAAGFLNSYMAAYLLDMKKKGLNESLWQEALDDASVASSVGVDSEDDFRTFFYIDHFVEDLAREVIGVRLDKEDEESLKKFMFGLRNKIDYSDITLFRAAVLKWLESKKKIKSTASVSRVDTLIEELAEVRKALSNKKKQEEFDDLMYSISSFLERASLQMDNSDIWMLFLRSTNKYYPVKFQPEDFNSPEVLMNKIKQQNPDLNFEDPKNKIAKHNYIDKTNFVRFLNADNEEVGTLHRSQDNFIRDHLENEPHAFKGGLIPLSNVKLFLQKVSEIIKSHLEHWKYENNYEIIKNVFDNVENFIISAIQNKQYMDLYDFSIKRWNLQPTLVPRKLEDRDMQYFGSFDNLRGGDTGKQASLKLSHPNQGTNYQTFPKYDLDKWQNLAQKIVQSMTIGFSRDFALKDVAGSNLEDPERLDFMAWFNLLANREGDKFNVNQQIKQKNQDISRMKYASSSDVEDFKEQLRMIWDTLRGSKDKKNAQRILEKLKLVLSGWAYRLRNLSMTGNIDGVFNINWINNPIPYTKRLYIKLPLGDQQSLQAINKVRPEGIPEADNLLPVGIDSGQYYIRHGSNIIGYADWVGSLDLVQEDYFFDDAEEFKDFKSIPETKVVIDFIYSAQEIIMKAKKEHRYEVIGELAHVCRIATGKGGIKSETDYTWKPKDREDFEEMNKHRSEPVEGAQMNELTKLGIYGDQQFYYVPNYKAPAPALELPPVATSPVFSPKSEQNAMDFEAVRKKMIGRVFSLDKLIEKYKHVLSEEAISGIESTLNELRSKIRKLKKASTANDVLIKTARILNSKYNFKAGAEYLIAIAEEDEEVLNAEPVEDPDAAGTKKQHDALTKIVQELYWLSATVKNRGLVRELAKIDIQLNDLNMSSFFTELMDAQAKLIESFNYVGNKLDDVLPKLQSSLVAGQLADVQKTQQPSPIVDEVNSLSQNIQPRKTTPKERALLEQDKNPVEVVSPAPESNTINPVRIPLK